MKYTSLFALFSVLFVLACQDDDYNPTRSENITTTIQFRAEYDNTNLAIQSATYA